MSRPHLTLSIAVALCLPLATPVAAGDKVKSAWTGLGDGLTYEDLDNWSDGVANDAMHIGKFESLGAFGMAVDINQDGSLGDIVARLRYRDAVIRHLSSGGKAHHLPGTVSSMSRRSALRVIDSVVRFDQDVAADGDTQIRIGSAGGFGFSSLDFHAAFATNGHTIYFRGDRERDGFPPSGGVGFLGPVNSAGNFTIDETTVFLDNTANLTDVHANHGGVFLGPMADLKATKINIWNSELSFEGAANPLPNLASDIKSWGGRIGKFAPGSTLVPRGVDITVGHTRFQQGFMAPGSTSILDFDGILDRRVGGTAAFEIDDPANLDYQFNGASGAHPTTGLIPYAYSRDQITGTTGSFAHARFNAINGRVEAFTNYTTDLNTATVDDAVMISGLKAAVEPLSVFAVLFGQAEFDLGGAALTTSSIMSIDFNANVSNATVFPLVSVTASGIGTSSSHEANELVILIPAQNDRLILDNVDIQDLNGTPTAVTVAGTRGRLLTNSAQNRTGPTYVSGVAVELLGPDAGLGTGMVELTAGADLTLQNNTLANPLRIHPSPGGFLPAVQADGASTMSGDVELVIDGANDVQVDLGARDADDHLLVAGTFTRDGSGNGDLGQGLAAVRFGQPFDRGLIELAPSADLTDPGVLSVFNSHPSVGRTVIHHGSVGNAEVIDNVTLAGNGSYHDLAFVGNAATLAPGSSLGTTAITGDLVFGGTDNTYAAELDDAGNSDRLDITGLLDLVSDTDVLDISFLTGDTLNGAYTLATYNDVSGIFDTVMFRGAPLADPTAPGAFDGTHQLIYGPGALLLATEVPPVPGDADGDGDVDAFDLGLWQTQFGMTGDDLSADFDMDGDVDAFDLGIWQINFGTGVDAVVPEPATGWLLWSAWIASRRRTRHTRS